MTDKHEEELKTKVEEAKSRIFTNSFETPRMSEVNIKSLEVAENLFRAYMELHDYQIGQLQQRIQMTRNDTPV